MNPLEAKRRAQAANLALPKAESTGDLFAGAAENTPLQPATTLHTPRPAESAEVSPPTAPKAGPAPLPLPPSQPQHVRVTLVFTPEEYAVFREAETHARKLLPTKRTRREAAVAEMARRSLAATSARTRARHTVIVHVNATTGGAWFETDRGTLPVSADELDEALTTGTITVANAAPVENRTPAEQIPRGKRKRPPIPVHILRQLYARAGGCCEAPGCTNRHHLQVHHRQAWSRGGTHELDGLELRCSACHGQTHAEDYRTHPQWSRARARRRGTRSQRQGAALSLE